MAFASAFLTALFGYKDRKAFQLFRSPPWLGIIAALLLAFNYFGFMQGIALTSASNTQVMIQTGPLTFALIGLFVFRERFSKRQLLGLMIAGCGFGLFYHEQTLSLLQDQDLLSQGNYWIIAAALAWAAFASFQKVVLQTKVQPQHLNLLIYTIAAFALYFTADPQSLLRLGAFEIGLMCLLGLNTVLAYGALAEAIRLAPASHVSLIITLNPLITILMLQIMDWLQVDWVSPEPISLYGALGAIAVVTGVAVTIFKPKKPLQTSSQ